VSKRLILALGGILVFVAVGLAGCGGSDDEDATASSITKAEFIKQADEVCREGEKRVQKDFDAYVKENEDLKEPTDADYAALVAAVLAPNAEHLKEPTDADYAALVAAVLAPNAERETEQLRELGAPDGDEEQIEAMLEAREQGLKDAEARPKAVVTSGEDIFAGASKIATDYGLKVCGYP